MLTIPYCARKMLTVPYCVMIIYFMTFTVIVHFNENKISCVTNFEKKCREGGANIDSVEVKKKTEHTQ